MGLLPLPGPGEVARLTRAGAERVRVVRGSRLRIGW